MQCSAIAPTSRASGGEIAAWRGAGPQAGGGRAQSRYAGRRARGAPNEACRRGALVCPTVGKIALLT